MVIDASADEKVHKGSKYFLLKRYSRDKPPYHLGCELFDFSDNYIRNPGVEAVHLSLLRRVTT